MEIHPPTHSHREAGGEGGEGDNTALRMSDLGGEESKEEEEEGRGGGRRETEVADTAAGQGDFEGRMQSLQNEVDALSARLEEEQLHYSVPLTKSRLQGHNAGFVPSRSWDQPLGQAVSLTRSRLQGQPAISPSSREALISKLEEVERESSAVSTHMDQLQASVKKVVY